MIPEHDLDGDKLRRIVAKYFGSGKADDWSNWAGEFDYNAGYIATEFNNKAAGKMAIIVQREDEERLYIGLSFIDPQPTLEVPEKMDINFTMPVEATMTPPTVRDPAKNTAADKAVDIFVSGKQPPAYLVDEAGKALANRFCFALRKAADGSFEAVVEPLRHFEQTPESLKIVEKLLPGCEAAGAGVWKLLDPDVTTLTEAADYLNKLGIQWNKVLQDRIEPAHTKVVEAWHEAWHAGTYQRQQSLKQAAPRIKPHF